jgi:hypothetical protein
MQTVYEILHGHPVLSLAQAALTVWMLVDAYRRPADGFWLLVIFLFQPLGPWVYFFAVKARDFRGPRGWSLPARGPSLAELRYRAGNVPTLANHLALAQRLIQRQEYDEAVGHLEAGLKIEPDHGQLLYSLALCHARRGQPEGAVPLLQRLLDRDPRWSNYVAWHLLIEARTELEDYPGAVADCRELVRLAPTLEHQCLLAEHLLDGRQDREAREVLDRSLQDHTFAPGPIRWRNRRWARRARRLLRSIGPS